jgi:ArsR family transcriptional regulator, arsenate/arsenite/antimonite-responsive transcriptional repressor
MNRSTGRIFKALSDPNRIRIVKMLEVKDLCVCEVREVLGLSTSTVSKHLSILRDADLIVDAKDGKWVNYKLNQSANIPLVSAQLALMRNSFKDDEQVRSDRTKLQTVDRESICGI